MWEYHPSDDLAVTIPECLISQGVSNFVLAAGLEVTTTSSLTARCLLFDRMPYGVFVWHGTAVD